MQYGTLALQKLMAAGLAGLGLALLGYTVAVEGEPGALPLALVAGGALWFALVARRGRAG